MMVPRIAYVALVWPRSTIFGKTMAQRDALGRLESAGTLELTLTTNCLTGVDGDDYVDSVCSRLGRLRRTGRLHSLINVLWSYPKLYRNMYRDILVSETDLLYMRKPPIFDLVSVAFMAALHKRGVRVVMEIPTYPYDAEAQRGSLIARLDRLARRFAKRSVDVIATFSQDELIFGVPCVNIENGADLDRIPVSRDVSPGDGLDVTVVAALEPWHRIDRIVSAVVKAWDSGDFRIARLNIVGDGPQMLALRERAQSSMEGAARVIFHGPCFGDDLNVILARTDLAIGNLEEAADRGVGSAQALKHREYAARGLPFVYGLPDHSFDESPYAHQLPDGEIDLDAVHHWYESLQLTRAQIRADSERFRWEYQFELVLAAITSDSSDMEKWGRP